MSLSKLITVICPRCGKARDVLPRFAKRRRLRGAYCQRCAASLGTRKRWLRESALTDPTETVEERLAKLSGDRDA